MIIAMIAVFASGAYALDNIGDIHINDANGAPVHPYAIGDTVNIQGIITAEFTTATITTYSRAFIQDATGGINIYKYASSPDPDHICFLVGDNVSIGGHIEQYNGMVEVIIWNCTINSHGNPVPAPKVLTVSDMINTFDPLTYREPNEGRLIRINQVTITGTGTWSSKNWMITDDAAVSDTLYVYGGSGCAVHPLIGTPLPVGYFDVIGVLSQFDASVPRTAGYQISPRGPADIIAPPTEVLPSSWGKVKAMYR